ncbi:hypothetical protein CER19_00210 [Pseudomonas sp. GL93]|nr:hypothetical protein CER19_00210 [Pseudomonas sp. GL93]
MLAKNVNDDACFLNKRGVCGFFASKLAPTKKSGLFYFRALRITNLGVAATCSTPRNSRASLLW